ncbi:hypothetical protein WAI453_004982 [Rhynchosporium graminicola]
MATTNQLWVNLGRPLPELNAHKCLLVHQGNDEEALKIKFKRPSEFRRMKATLPEAMMLKGGCFMPVHQNEALWISFHSTGPFAIKVS